MTKDLVSVIIPTYNRAHLIKRSAMSVLNQTYGNLELIIVDDGSTDNTEEVVKSIDDDRVIYIKQPNQGACAARNNGIDHAQGEFIAFQDSDDEWHVDKLEKQIKCLKETGADMVYCRVLAIINGRTEIFGKELHAEGFLTKKTLPYGIGTQTFFSKTDVFRDEKFDANVPRYQDFEVLLRIQKKYTIYCLDIPLVDYYLQSDSITNNYEKLLKAWTIILEKNPEFMTIYSQYRRVLAISIFGNAVEAKNQDTKNKLIILAHKFDNSLNITLRLFLYKIGLFRTIRKIKKFANGW